MGLPCTWQCPDVMHLGYFCDIPAKNVQPESSEEMSDKAKLGDIPLKINDLHSIKHCKNHKTQKIKEL